MTWQPPHVEARHDPRGPGAPLDMPGRQIVRLRAAARDELRALLAGRLQAEPTAWVRAMRDVTARLEELGTW